MAGRPPSPNETVVLRDVRKSYDGHEVLKGVDLVAVENQTTVVLGGSGAGKTTLLRHIVGLEQPTSGEIWLCGVNIAEMKERDLAVARQKVGMVYQYAALLDSCTVLENVAFPLVEHTKLKSSEIEERVWKMLENLGLKRSVLTKFPAELSGGMRKRVGLARALMLEPPVLVYDEPTSGLDPLTSRVVDDLIEETRERYGVTSVVISHDIASCFRIAHQVVMLFDGRIIARGTPEELIHGDNEQAREFIERSGVDIAGLKRADVANADAGKGKK